MFVKKRLCVQKVWWYLLLGVLLYNASVCVFFHFHDALPKGEQYVKTEIPGSISTKNMYTTVDKKEELEALGGYLTQNHLTEKKVLLYGEIPAISYILIWNLRSIPPWADLRS